MALVITIIILIILAGVSISIVFGDNGIVATAKRGAEKYGEEAHKEALALMWQSYQIDSAETNKTFAEYLGEKGYDIDSSDVDGKTGTTIIDGKKYTFDASSGSLNVEYEGEATEEELSKPKFESATAVVEGTTVQIAATLKNSEGVTLTYAIKKETDENFGTEQASSTFAGLQTNTTYIIQVVATNEGGQTATRLLRAKTLSLAELTQGKANFSISPDTAWQKEVTATITSTYTLGTNEEIRYRIGETGEFTPYTAPYMEYSIIQ